jgi:hypothetical protein
VFVDTIEFVAKDGGREVSTIVCLTGVSVIGVTAAVETDVVGWPVVSAKFVGRFVAAGVSFSKVKVVIVFQCNEQGVALSAGVSANLWVESGVRHVGGKRR